MKFNYQFITKLVLIALGAFAVLAASSSALAADEHPRLTAYFTKKIGQMRDTLAKLEASADDPSMELQAFHLQLAPSVSFGLNNVVSLTVSPEIDFVLVPEEVK